MLSLKGCRIMLSIKGLSPKKLFVYVHYGSTQYVCTIFLRFQGYLLLNFTRVAN